jgi:6,7-dimethyl-8-ribityllumazine synthase
MSSAHQNLSSQKIASVQDFSNKKIGIVVAEWNSEITEKLKEGAFKTLIANGVKKENVFIHRVPGTFELTLGAQWLAKKAEIDAVIAIGCVIMGDTPHFDYICQSVSYGITEVNIKFDKPVIFGVLTTLNIEQSVERAGGKHGNKGDEAAITALKMLQF